MTDELKALLGYRLDQADSALKASQAQIDDTDAIDALAQARAFVHQVRQYVEMSRE